MSSEEDRPGRAPRYLIVITALAVAVAAAFGVLWAKGRATSTS